MAEVEKEKTETMGGEKGKGKEDVGPVAEEVNEGEDRVEENEDNGRAGTPELPADRILHPATILYLNGLPDDERRDEMQRLRGTRTAYEFERENNMIRNKYFMDQIFEGRTADDLIFGHSTAPKAPSVPPSPSFDPLTSPARNRTPTPAPAPPSLPLASHPPSPSFTVPASPGPHTFPDPRPSAAPIDPAADKELMLVQPTEFGGEKDNMEMEGTSVDKTGWPGWLRDSYDSLLGEGRPGGTLWSGTLNDWTELEGYYGFKNPIGSVGCNFIECYLQY